MQPQSQASDKELEAILTDAEERGLELADDKEQLLREASALGAGQQGLAARLREVIPLLPEGSRLGLRTGTPLAAFVDAPGIFVLRSSAATSGAAGTSRKSRSSAAFFQTLARGRKHLDLNDITSIDAEAATALSVAEGMLALDGLTSITAEVAKALSAYEGPFLSLNGLKAPDNQEDARKIMADMAPILDLVSEDRASAGGLYMMSVAGMRDFVVQSADSLPDKQKKLAKQFQANSGSRDWTNLVGQRVKGKVLAILGTDVVLDTPTGPSDKIAVTSLSPASLKVLKTLAELGSQLATLRTTSKFAAEGGQVDEDEDDKEAEKDDKNADKKKQKKNEQDKESDDDR